MYHIQNNHLSAAITETGVELASLTDKQTDLEYIWQADPEVWGSHAPVLFPIIGGLKDGVFTHKGQEYALPKHGMVRRNPNLKVVAQTENAITLELTADAATRIVYPFDFTFRVTYRLEGRTLFQEHEVINNGEESLWFSLGGHPAFRVPLREGEAYDEYKLVFAEAENARSYVVNSDGLIGAETVAVPWTNDNQLPLTHGLFANDALVFKDLKSREVQLVNGKEEVVLTVRYADFNYLGIWAKPTGDFVCIEPWLGIADAWNASGQLTEKEGVIELAGGGVFKAGFSMEV